MPGQLDALTAHLQGVTVGHLAKGLLTQPRQRVWLGHWWVDNDGEHRTFSARRRGGQFIYVITELDLVTVITCDPE
jgi:CubicO group peptidase (beta-lactamase class C family)